MDAGIGNYLGCNCPLNQFLICAAAEKLSVFATEDYLKMRAGRADLDFTGFRGRALCLFPLR